MKASKKRGAIHTTATTLDSQDEFLSAFAQQSPAKLNNVDPQAWLADTLARIPDYNITRVDDLLPWNSAK